LHGWLEPAIFLRINRKAIINLDHVTAFELRSGGDFEVELDGGERLRTTKRFRAPVQRLLGHLDD
jgi:two-component system LytT family response regulator